MAVPILRKSLGPLIFDRCLFSLSAAAVAASSLFRTAGSEFEPVLLLSSLLSPSTRVESLTMRSQRPALMPAMAKGDVLDEDDWPA